MQFEGTTIFINSELVIEIANRASLHDFAGVILLCLGRKMSRESALAELHEVAVQLRALNMIPQDCAVEHIGLGCDNYGRAGLIVNYTERNRK
jgi:hypothetical protein